MHVGSLHRRIHPNRKKTWPCIFACPKTDAIQISDGPRNPANNIATFPQLLLQYIYAAHSVNNNALFAHTSALTAMDISTPLQVSTAFRRLSELIKSPPIISILLPLASQLELSNATSHTFYTNGAFSRLTKHPIQTTCDSGFVAPSSSILLSQRTQLSFTCTHWLSAYKAEVMVLLFYSLLFQIIRNA